MPSDDDLEAFINNIKTAATTKKKDYSPSGPKNHELQDTKIDF
jgi:hypothetical protein